MVIKLDFDDLVGQCSSFYGVDDTRFKLGGIVWKAVENEPDGYRSFLEVIRTTSEEKCIFFKQPLAEVVVDHDEYTETFKNGYTHKWRGYRLIERNPQEVHVWLEIGTEDYDGYYPMFRFNYYPKEKNET